MRHLLQSLLGLAVMISVTACAPKLMGPTASSGYFFSVQGPPPILLRTDAEVFVRVQDAAGQPVEGLPVMFEVDASWSREATISPARVPTQNGEASALIHVSIIGVVPIWVTVDGTTQAFHIAVVERGTIPSGP